MASVVELVQPSPSAPTPDQMVAAIDGIVPELQAYALEEEKAGKLSDETVRRLAELRVFDVAIPREYGGLGFDTADQRKIYTAVGKIAGSTGWVTWVTTTHARWITMWPAKAQDEVFGLNWPAPRISGVITANGPGKARAVEGGFMLSGKWPFASGCRHAAFCILGAAVSKEDGPPEMYLMLVPTSELEILDDWHVSGMKASSSNSVQLATETFVPAYRTVSFIQALFGTPEKPLPANQVSFRNNFATYTTITSGSTPLGMAKGALDYFMSRVDKRAITATDYKVQADAAVTHFQVSEAIAKIENAERLLDADAREIDRRAGADEPFDDLFRAKVRFDVAASVRACAEVTETLHRASGASTIQESNPMQRYARDARVATVHGQFNYETCAEDYGRALCGKPIFGSPVLSEVATLAPAPAAAPSDAPADVNGAWDVVITSPLGAQKSVLTIQAEGSIFTGSFEGEMGSLPIENARVDGNTVSWSMKLVKPIPIVLDCTATVVGDQIDGKAAAPIGSFPLTGTRAVTRMEESALATLLTKARSQNGWSDEPVDEADLRAAYDIARWGPTSMNTQPMRLVFLRSAEAKERLKPALMPGNVDKAMSAPVIAIIAYDLAFHTHLPVTFPHNPGAQAFFDGKDALLQDTAFRNGTLQGAYFMLALRAVGLDVGPMSGFAAPLVDAAFFADTTYQTNFLCGIGRGDPAKVFSRSPRLPFDQVASIL